MAVCSFFLKGYCKFGSTCRNSHVVDGANKTASNSSLPGPDSFDTISRTMHDDLTTEKPLYYLSVYSPHKLATNMIDGTDVSPEELRFQAYQARANNNPSQYVAHESQLLQQMDSVTKMVVQNCKESYKHFYHTRMALNHPDSTFRKPTPGVTSFGVSAFGSPNQPTTFGQAASAFGGQSAGGFGAFSSQGAAPGVSAFGQPSSVRPTVSAFGQQVSAFGTTPSVQPGAVTAFGKPSTFGAPAPVASAFGGTSAPSAFGQPSAFGAPTAFGATSQTGATAFGAATQTTGATAFGGASQPNIATAFGGAAQPTGATAFGASDQSGPSSSVSAFGQTAPNNPPTAFGQPTNTATGFGQPSAFGQPQAPSAFGKPSAFGQPAFGQPAPFGSSAAHPSSTAATAFGQSAFGGSSSPFGQASSVMGAPSNSQAASVGGGGGGFAAFAAIPNPSKTVSFGNSQATTTPPGPTQDTKPAVSAFGQPVTPPNNTSTLASTSIFGASSQTPAKAPSQSFDNRAAEKFKLLDPFWENAPKESDLSPALLDAFKAEFFAWDLIPDVPPPITLR
ncbi:hypothetical protein PCANC_03131 [Puccinia coronata f. sp. avenae]|uniref:C3H1-type domain-containing protein n=1 Tax=Puccinia coronata f. sp. avenae TaxID=200324 RepID=A0A2N5W4N7_9BASI|nr:hypothetical protein PCANC_03131 [Puccinia coronata f. sp. avenae]